MLWALPPVYSLLSLTFLIGVFLAQSTLPVGIKIVGIGLISSFASFILGNGLFFWIALPAVLLLYEDFQRLCRSRISLGVFAALLGVTIAGYVMGSTASMRPELNPISIGLFFLAYTGNFVSLSVTPQPVHLAEAAGALIILSFAVAAPAAIRGRTAGQRKIVLVWILFGMFWFLSGLTAAIARHSFGVSYALGASRYVAASAFFLLAALVVAAMALKDIGSNFPQHRGLYLFLTPSVAILLLVAILCRYPQIKTGNVVMENSRYLQLQGKVAVASVGLLELPSFQNIFPHSSYARFTDEVRFLNSRGWLRPTPWDERFLRHLGDLTPNGSCGVLDSVTRAGDSVRLLGWGYLPSRSQRAHAIIVAGFEPGKIPKILGVAFVGQPRPDVAAALHSAAALQTGWTIDLPLTASGEHRYVLQSFAYDAEDGQACEMIGGRPAP
jgi:hypothetical protein